MKKDTIKKAGAIIMSRDLKSIALVCRVIKNDWTFPKGHIEEGETEVAAMRREVLEETGMSVEVIKDLPDMKYIDGKCNIEVCLVARDHNLESSIFVVGTRGSMKVAGVALSEFVYPEIEQTELEKHDSHYYGSGHTALYKTHSNHYLQNFDPDDALLAKPSDLVNTLKLIEAIEKLLDV